MCKYIYRYCFHKTIIFGLTWDELIKLQSGSGAQLPENSTRSAKRQSQGV